MVVKKKIMFERIELLLIAQENLIHILLWQLRSEQAHKEHHREAPKHSNGTTVDGVDGIANEHVDHGEAHTPGKASPDRGRGDTTPIESQHERSQEGTSQRTP